MTSKQSTNKSETPDFVDPDDAGTGVPLDTKENQDIAFQRFTREDLAGITTLQDAINLARAQFGEVLSIADTDLADGFRKATEDDKASLVRVPLFFLDWSFNVGDFSTEYVSIRAIQYRPDGSIVKWIINDGGVGIPAELKAIEERNGRSGGLAVPHGLRVSTYKTDAATGKPISKKEYAEYIRDHKKTSQGSTYYLDTSA
jgi:hypothetical protein